MHWAGLMHTALAPASNSCIRLMHPPPLLPSPHPTSQANTPLVHFWRLNTHQGQGESLFHSSGIVSRLKLFTFCWVAKFHFEAIINLIEIKMYFQGHIPFKDNSISLSWAETMSKFLLTSFFLHMLNFMW